MKKHLSLVAAAAIAAGSYAFMTTGLYAEDDKTTAGQKVDRAIDKTGDAAGEAVDKTKDAVGNLDVRTEESPGTTAGLPAGIQKATSDDSEDIRDVLSEVTEKAFGTNEFDDSVTYFVDADRNRIKPFVEKEEKFTTLNGRIAQIKKDYKAKYNKDLDIDHKVAFGPEFKGFQILQGEIVNPQLLTNWPVKSSAGGSGPAKSPSSVDVKDDGKIDKPAVGELGKPSDRPADRNLEKGRNVAIVNIPASHGLPSVTVSMIHEMPDSWKIDVPDHVDGQRLHDQLLNHLTHFGENKDQWPADATDWHRAAAHHVLAAVYDVSVPAKTGAGAGTSGGASSSTPK